MNTRSKTSGWVAMHCDSTLPPSMSSVITVSTSRNRGESMESRMSRKPSRIGMPERTICSMSKQKLIRSWRVTAPPAPIDFVRRSTCLQVIRSSPMRRSRSSRSTSLTASSPPRAGWPVLSIALYSKEAISQQERKIVSSLPQAAGQIHCAGDFGNTGNAIKCAGDAFFSQ